MQLKRFTIDNRADVAICSSLLLFISCVCNIIHLKELWTLTMCYCFVGYRVGLFVLLARRGRTGAANARPGVGFVWKRGRHLPFQQPIPGSIAVVWPGSSRGGSLFCTQQFGIYNLHRLLHQLSKVRYPFLLLCL